MAKQIKKQIVEVVEPSSNGHRPDFFVNSRGIKVQCLPVEPQYVDKLRERVQREFRDRGEPVDAPTYEIEVLGGGKKTVPHDEKSVQTDEEKALWQAHVEVTNRLTNEMTRRVVKALIARGVANEPTPEWITEQELLGFDLPTDPLRLKIDYAESELIVKAPDVQELMIVPLLLSFTGLTDEEFKELEANFRGFMENVGTGSGDSSGGPETAGNGA
jgi:hypothetical protein